MVGGARVIIILVAGGVRLILFFFGRVTPVLSKALGSDAHRSALSIMVFEVFLMIVVFMYRSKRAGRGAKSGRTIALSTDFKRTEHDPFAYLRRPLYIGRIRTTQRHKGDVHRSRRLDQGTTRASILCDVGALPRQYPI